MNQIHFGVIAGVRMAVNELTDDEVVALNLAMSFVDAEPTSVKGYDKIKDLFTEGKMHHDTKQAFMACLNERLKTIL